MKCSPSKASLGDDAFDFIARLQQFLVTQVDHVHLKDQTAQWILNEVFHIYPVAGLSLWLNNDETKSWNLAASVGLDGALHKQLFQAPGAYEHLNQVRTTGQPVILDHLCEHSYAPFRQWSKETGIKRTASFPLFGVPTCLLGVLTVMWIDPPLMDQVILERWENVARTLALAWQWTELWQSHSLRQVVARTVTSMTQSAYAYVYEDRLEVCNRQFLELFHLEPPLRDRSVKKMVQQMQKIFLDEDKVEQVIQQLNNSQHNDFDAIFELKGVPTRYLRWMSRPVHLRGVYQGRICVFNDVTSQVLSEQYHESFLSLVAHEFRTPVTIIQGLAELMESTPLPDNLESWNKHIHLIWREALRLSRLIREIWGASEATKRGWDHFSESLDFIKVVESEMATAKKLWPDCHWDYVGPESLPVRMNYEILMTILQALIGNAGRFSPPFSQVTVEVENDDQWVTLRVMDRGPGVDAAIAEELFTRVPDLAHRSGSGGMGLGLYVTATFVKMMGGEIHYHPRCGGGSIFTVTLPREAPAIRRLAP